MYLSSPEVAILTTEFPIVFHSLLLICITLFQPENFYAKQIEGDLPYAYIKSTINSTHKNQFEVTADRKQQENMKV